MAESTYRIFVSAVSGEFRNYRREVARVLRTKGLEVRDQDHFKQGSATLLERLRDYICECDAVILLIGECFGAFPTELHEGALGPIPEFERYRSESGQTAASYTQWEFFLAKHFRKPTFVFLTGATFKSDGSDTEDLELARRQQAYRSWIKTTGEHRDALTTPEKLIEHVLLLPFPNLSRPKPIALPYPSLGALFKGRKQFLAELEANLQGAADGKAKAIVGKALHGLGGIGKTRLAVEYAWRHTDEYTAVLFVIADTPENLRRNLAELTGPLVLNLPEHNAKEEKVRLAAALNWLRTHPHWFLILDNVDTPEAAREVDHWLANLQGGHIILTTRLPNWKGHVETLDLNVLEIDAATEYLLERTSKRRRSLPDDQAQARRIAIELGQLSLGLEQAAAYIALRRLSFADYLNDWFGKRESVLSWFDSRLMEYPASVAVTWQASFDQLSESARYLIQRLAWLSPQPIPESLLEVPVPSATESTEEIGAALVELEGFSLITREPQTRTFMVHRLIQEVTRHKQTGGIEEMVTRLAAQLATLYPKDGLSNPRSWLNCSQLTPHVLALWTICVERKIKFEAWPELLNAAGTYSQGRGLYSQATALLRDALAIREEMLGPTHPQTATSLNNLASVLHDNGQFAEARALYERALASYETALGPEHVDTAGCLNNLANLLKDQGDPGAAKPLFERALSIYENALGPEHAHTATTLNNIAMLLQDQGDLANARSVFERALTILEKASGQDHPHTATNLRGLASVMQAQGDLGGARVLYERVLSVREKTLGRDHPDTATAVSSLAFLLQAQGDLGAAKSLYRRALTIYEKMLGHEHPNTNRARHHLARALLASAEDGAEALALAEAALAAHTNVPGRHHSWTLDSALVTAEALEMLGRHEEAAAVRFNYGLASKGAGRGLVR